MTESNDETILSLLADGELESDRLNEVLLDVLDQPEAREKLKKHLRLRQSFRAWRRQGSPAPAMIVGRAPGPARLWTIGLLRHGGGLAVAACIGGLLVMAGVWLAGPRGPTGQAASGGGPAVAAVSAEQRMQLGRAFQLHESVAGPLSWYAADERSIQVGSVDRDVAVGRPIGVLLRLAAAGERQKTYALVVRDNQPASMDLPDFDGRRGGVRVYLAPAINDGQVEVDFTIALPPDRRGADMPAVLAGRHKLSADGTSLGQVSWDDRLVSINAAAWPIGNRQ